MTWIGTKSLFGWTKVIFCVVGENIIFKHYERDTPVKVK